MTEDNRSAVTKPPQVIATKLQVIGLVVIIFILLLAVFLTVSIVLKQLQKQDVLLSSGLTRSSWALDQVHRETLRLLALVGANNQSLDSEKIQLQRNLAESRFAIIRQHHINDDLSVELRKDQTEANDAWLTLQVLLDDWQTDLTNESLQTLIVQELVALELRLNTIVAQQIRQRRGQYGKLLGVRSQSLLLFGVVSALLFVFIGFVAYSTYRFIQERQRVLLALHESEEQYRKAKEKAEIANQAKSDFLSNMSHELRTPLNVILGFSNLMRREALRGENSLTKTQQENLGLINRSGEHLLTLINNVLDLSKIEAGRTTLNTSDFDLYRLLNDIVDMFSLKADEKGLHLLLEYTSKAPQFIRTDTIKLKQILVNLLSNALKFTEQGGIVIRASCAHTDQCSRIHFEVEDTGPGIATDELDILFEAFAQTATGRGAKEGTGLGLAISNEFVELMGGKLEVRSEVNKGTVFFFDIDVEVIKESELEKVTSKQVIGLKPNQPSYRILIVDDNENNRLLLIKLLQPLGFELKEARDGQGAVDIWRQWQPHLIWMDIRMPVMDGYTATKTIRAEPKGQETKIIALTASTLEEEKVAVLAAGCNDYYRKPFREKDIFGAMNYHIGVEYIYEEVEGTVSKVDPKEFLSREVLKVVPTELLTKLEKLAILANIMEVNKVIEEINSYDGRVARALTTLADDFRYPEIAEVARVALNTQNTVADP